MQNINTASIHADKLQQTLSTKIIDNIIGFLSERKIVLAKEGLNEVSQMTSLSLPISRDSAPFVNKENIECSASTRMSSIPSSSGFYDSQLVSPCYDLSCKEYESSQYYSVRL